MSKIETPVLGLIEVIRRLDSIERLETDPDTFLEELGVSKADRAALLKLGVNRLCAYRSLVHNGTGNVIVRFLPRTGHFLGKERIWADISRFIAEEGPSTNFLRTIPGEFVRWAHKGWEGDSELPDFIMDLARYEVLSQDVPNDPAQSLPPTGVPIALDLAIVANPSAKLVRFEWRVDLLDEEAPQPPSHQPVTLAICRDGKHAYREQVLSDLGAELFQGLSRNLTLKDAIFAAAAAAGLPVEDTLLERATYALGELMEIEALLGAPVAG